jgi:long-chain fatty acid transport protein
MPIIRGTCLGVVLLSASAARGSGFAAAEFGGEHGTVVTTDPTALYYNPAGIALGQGTHLYASGVFALRRGEWTHARAPSEPPVPPGAEGADAGEAHFSNLLAAPALAATTWIRRLAIGAAFYVPLGGQVHWDSNQSFAGHQQFPLAVDGVQRWHVIEGALRSLYFTLGAGIRLGPLSIGVTGNVIRSSVYLRKARSFSPSPVDPSSEGRIVLDVAGTHASAGIGAMFEALADQLWFGASYQAQPGFGPLELEGTLTIGDGSGSVATRPATYTFALPDVARFGIRFRPTQGAGGVELRAYGDVTRWSRLRSQCISLGGQPCAVFPDGSDATPGATTIENLRYRWNDTYGANAGASYWLNEKLELFAGIGFATAATPDATLDPVLPDATNVRFALGGRFALPARFHVTAGVSDVHYWPRDNSGRSTLADPQPPTRHPDGGGQYRLWLGIFHLSVEKQL